MLSFPRRKDIYNICSRFDVIIIEDDPYWTLYYPSANSNSIRHRGTPLSTNFPIDIHYNYSIQSLNGQSTGHRFLDNLVPSFLSIDVDGRVIRLDSFSKTIAPGLRLGWITAQPSICEQLFRITDGTTQQPSGFAQTIVARLIGDFGTKDTGGSSAVSLDELPSGWGLEGWVSWLEGLRSTYERRMITMATSLEENRFLASETGQVEMFTFNWPLGGMFIWVQVKIFNHPLSSSIDPRRLMLALWNFCTQQPYRILAVPGVDFAANDAVKNAEGYQFLRFCFAAVEESILAAKSKSFADACAKFWGIEDARRIDDILQEEDLLASANQTAEESAVIDREIIEDW